MAAILDFSILSKLLKLGWQLHTRLDIIMGMPDMNNQKRKKLYQTKQGLPSWLPDYYPCYQFQ